MPLNGKSDIQGSYILSHWTGDILWGQCVFSIHSKIKGDEAAHFDLR